MNKLISALALSLLIAGCSTSKMTREEQSGYYVGIHESQARGGVASYVPRHEISPEDYLDKGEYTATRGKPEYSPSGTHEQASVGSQTQASETELTTEDSMDEVTTSQSAPAPQVPEAPPQSDPKQLVTELRDDLHFEFNSATLKPTATQQLESLGDVLSQNQETKLIVSGHADAVGSDTYNEDLSQQRAEAVREILISRGVRPDQIKIQGYGEDKPVASNETDDGRARNRRVDLNIG